MAVDFKESETMKNLMRAFAGESQARNRYTLAAGQAKRNKQAAIASVFLYTANQEKEHAEIFYNYLSEMAGENIHIEGSYPVDLSNNLAELLRMAQHNEYEEYDDVYKEFGDKAKKEGFDRIASSFYMIAEIEKTHGDRFGKFAELLEKDKLHVSDVKTGWVCINCGYVHEGEKAPEVCPVCHHDKGFFILSELSPYHVAL
ncbi:MAG: rubrerythrin family protein [Lachnospiraceae bacterium]|nr:rubrerythrin family protein [Lachnospiraceae bacterium]